MQYMPQINQALSRSPYGTQSNASVGGVGPASIVVPQSQSVVSNANSTKVGGLFADSRPHNSDKEEAELELRDSLHEKLQYGVAHPILKRWSSLGVNLDVSDCRMLEALKKTYGSEGGDM